MCTWLGVGSRRGLSDRDNLNSFLEIGNRDKVIIMPISMGATVLLHEVMNSSVVAEKLM